MKETIHKLSKIILLLLMAMGVCDVWAQTPASSIWDGSTVATAFASGSGTQADPYIIETAAQFAYFGANMNNKTWYVELAVDIDLDNKEWKYGKNSTSNFKGHFNGKHGKDIHTIKNLKFAPVSQKNNGLFSSLQGTATSRAGVKNLIIEGVTISESNALAATTTTGALAGNVTEYTDIDCVTVKNVSITLDKLSNANYVGAFAGRIEKNRSTITQCVIENPSIKIGAISNKESYIGGAIGYVAGSAGLTSVIDDLTVKSPSVEVDDVSIKSCYIGAVFGRLNTFFSVNNVNVSAPTLKYNITGTTNADLFLGTLAGGFAGNTTQQVPITNVQITGTAQLTLGKDNTVEAKNIRAGLIGQVTSNVLLENWTVEKSILQVNSNLTTATSYLGAFAGILAGATAASTIVNNIVLGSRDGTGPGGTIYVASDVKISCSIGGFAGQVTTNCQLKGCTIYRPAVETRADITTASFIGGAIGDFLGTAGNTSFITGPLKVVSPSVTINKNSVANSYIGAVFGRIKEYSNVKNVTASTPTLTYKNTPNYDLYLGTFAGNIVGNNVQEVIVSDIDVTGDANLTIGTKDNSISKMRAGVIGQATSNVRLEDWTVENSSVTVNGSLASSASSLGGFAGYLASASNAPLRLNDITVKKTTVNVTGGVGIKDCGLGGFIGQVVPGDALKAPIYIDNIKIENGGATSLSIGGDITVTGNYGGFAGYVLGRAKAGTHTQLSNLNISKAMLNVGGKTSASCNYGGIIGLAHQTCQFNDWTVSAAQVTIGETKQDNTKVDVSAETYVGGAIGRITGAVGYNMTATGISLSGLDIAIDSELKHNLYVGGLAGRLDAYTTPNLIEKSSAKGLIRSKGSHTFAKAKGYCFGGILGYTEHNAGTNVSEVNNCVSEVNFDLSGFSPADVSGSLYNLQQNGFVVGGVIGRIHKPSRLPEALYYSGKIYAPFAAVAPIVGVFSLDISKNVYVYNDYCGINASAISSDEWAAKEQTWFYNGYKIGLSSAVTGQTDRTKNYKAASVSEGYLTIEDVATTFTEQNKISNAGKSYTVLAYTTDNKTNVDKGIFPQWNTDSKTYPAYYMYYMQGVNRGSYVKTSDAEAKKRDILAGTLTILTLSDANGDLSVSANRGFVNHTLTASATSADSYRWTVDGVVQAGTTGTLVIKPTMKGNTIIVEAIKGGKSMSRKQIKLMPVFRVRDAATEIGTKANPYLIGSADELQLLSYLSTLPLGTQWENTYTSADHYNKAYYEMDGDIDLSGVADFTPISCATGFLVNAAINQGYVFDGVFDGKMHKISGLKEMWYGGAVNVDNTHVGWGLFSIVGNPIASLKVGDTATSPAAIRNLVIDGAVLTHKTDNTTFYYGTTGKNASNCCVGVLTGIVQSNTKIDNIEIHNSKITDTGSSAYKLETRGLYVGGAVGSMQNAFNEVGNPCANTKIQHVAAQVDITLEYPAFTSATAVAQVGQFNIGGIIGRYCATSALQGQVQASMPAYTLYSGSVTASKAWISPVLGAVRFSLQYKTDDWKLYSKQWEGNNNADGTQLTIINAQYYNFRINGTLMTDLRPATACARGARPIMEHTDGTESQGTYDPQKSQGVNYAARYLDSEGTSLEHLNKNVFDDIYWAWDDDGSKKFVHMTATQPMNVSVIKGDRVYTADIENGSEPLIYAWQESTDLENWSDIAGATSSTWNVPLSYTEEKYIVAHVIKDGKVYRSFPFLFTPTDYIQPPAVKEDKPGDQHNFSLNWHDLTLTGLDITYQWYQKDRKTEISGATNETLSLSTAELESYGGAVWCKVTLSKDGEEFKQFFVSSGMIVVYINGNNYNKNGAKPGNDDNDGMTPQTPVKTIDKANSLLDGGSWDRNIIVVMGTLHNDKIFQSSGKNPATLTGKWGGIDYEGVVGLKQINPSDGEHSLNHATWPGEKGSNCYVLGPTKFENLIFNGNNGDNCFIELHGNDAFFGKGLVMKGFKQLSENHGNLTNETTPEFTIILSATNPGKADVDAYTNRTKPQEVTFQSGHYGRILAGRFTQNFFAKADNTAHSILGSPEHPYWAVVNIDIDEDNAQTDGGSTRYTCDINALIAGLTDGSMYADYKINISGGKIVYIVGSNQGNPINNGSANYAPVDGGSGGFGQWPNASYFGRTIINVDESVADGVKIGNLYAGGLGRPIQDGSTSTVVDMYFYGRTEVNMTNGTIEGSIYGGGTGGVIGINPWDAHVPYATLDADNASNAILNGVQYGDNRQGTWSSMNAESPKAKVILHNLQNDGTYLQEELDISESSTTINITGGTINENVYGGGYGFVSNMPESATMQGVGSVFGTSNINISGGTIGGSVYGGSEGSDKYYNQINKYGQVITHIAEMNGTVNLRITGTDDKYPTIGGDIFGGGLGIASEGSEEYLRIATSGNTDLGEQYKTDIHILIDLPESHPFDGNIYGGGQMGAVDGSTQVVIKGGIINGDIFGAGKGEAGHINKAKVTGTTNVIVDKGWTEPEPTPEP